MSYYELQDILHSKQQLEESESTSSHVCIKKNSKKITKQKKIKKILKLLKQLKEQMK